MPQLRLVAVPGNRTASKERWIDRAEEDWGEWGTIYLDEGDRLLGSLQYGPSHLFPRAADLPAGPASEDAVLVTCSYLKRNGAEWIEKSLLLAAIGESRDRGAKALEAFAYRYPRGESVEERFLVHRTVFPRDFLDEFGFVTVRAQGRVELCRLELGGLVPVEEGSGRGCSASSRRPSRRHPRPCRGRNSNWSGQVTPRPAPGTGNERGSRLTAVSPASPPRSSTPPLALAPKVGYELIELASVTCCGAGAVPALSRVTRRMAVEVEEADGQGASRCRSSTSRS